MDDSIIVLSSDDETLPEKDVKVEGEGENLKTEYDVDPLEETGKAEITKRRGEINVETDSSVSQPKKPKHTSDNDVTSSCSSPEDSNMQESSESSVFREFISTCLKLDDSPSMKKIIDSKLKKYYSLLIPEYKKSEQFYLLVERKQAEMLRCPSHLYRHLKEFIDELKVHRSDKGPSKGKASDHFIRKLCKAMEMLHRKIKKLEEREVDWEDDNESVYLQLQRYRERFIKVHNKLQELEGNTKPVFKRKISFSGTQFPSINRAIEKYVNTKGEFPDYHDIHELLKKSYTSEGIDVSAAQLKAEAKSVFQNVGEQLQKQRKYECWEVHSSFLENDDDPAEKNLNLRSILEENKIKYGSRIDEVINSFAERPNKSQFTSDDSNSSAVHQTEGKDKQEDVNGNGDLEENRGNDIEDTKDQGKEENECDNGTGGQDEHDDDDDDNDDDDEDGEDSASKTETMEDILNDVECEANEEYTEELNLYHGPLSPKEIADKLDVDSLSPLHSPCHSLKTEGEEQDNVSAVVKDEPSDMCVNEETKQGPTASCSNQNENDPLDSEENLSENSVQPSEECKPYLKVKPLSSLVNATKEPVEILLD